MSSKFIDNLVSSAKKGSAEAFGELYEIYSKDLSVSEMISAVKSMESSNIK